MEDNQHRRRIKGKTTEMEDDRNGRPNIKYIKQHCKRAMFLFNACVCLTTFSTDFTIFFLFRTMRLLEELLWRIFDHDCNIFPNIDWYLDQKKFWPKEMKIATTCKVWFLLLCFSTTETARRNKLLWTTFGYNKPSNLDCCCLHRKTQQQKHPLLLSFCCR